MFTRLRALLLTACLLVSQLAFAPAYAQDDAVQEVEKTFCASALGFTSLDELKDQLLLEAKRLAVNELFGELITASTTVEDFIVTSDQIAATSVGFVRVAGNAGYANGSNLAEVCVTIRAFVTQDDLAQFEPVALTKRLCQARPDLSADELASLTKEEAIIQALYDYDAALVGKERAALLSLIHKVTYSESDFLEGTTTYCAKLEGYVTPIEVLAFRSGGALAAATGSASPASGEGEGAQPSQQPGSRFAPDCAETIEFGQMLNCALETEGQSNKHSFEAEADDVIRFTLVRTNGDIEPTFEVHDKNGEIIDIDPHSLSSTCEAYDDKVASQTCILARSGRYTILVYSNATDTSGGYRLDVQRLNDPGFATPVELGVPTEGGISADFETHYYIFEADVDDVIRVTLMRTDGDIEPAFEVYGKDGEIIDINPHSLSSTCKAYDSKAASQTCTLARSGRYTIAVHSNAPDTAGGFTLTVESQ